MDLMKISDFCRKYSLPQHRFTRYKYLFELDYKEGYQKPWVKVTDKNISIVANILAHTGTRPKKQRLTYEDYKIKYGLDADHFQDVWHRLHLEEQNGKMLIIDSKQNYSLLKHGRLIRKKS
jgi:hypothetical protein